MSAVKVVIPAEKVVIPAVRKWGRKLKEVVIEFDM